jgi:hypothetical protein
MPIVSKRDKIGKYLQWGKHGKKYYFNENERSFKAAHIKVINQMRAAYANGYSGK